MTSLITWKKNCTTYDLSNYMKKEILYHMCFKISMAVSVDEETFSLDSVVRGHHVYKLTWTPVVGQELQVAPEPRNIKDGKAVETLMLLGIYQLNSQRLPGILFSMEAEFPA